MYIYTYKINKEWKAAAEVRKKRKYSHLDQCHLFVPGAIETTGVFGPETLEFLRELGRRLQLVSADHNSSTYLIYRLSVAVQRGNAASVLGSAGNRDPHDFFEAPSVCFSIVSFIFHFMCISNCMLYCIHVFL